MITKFYASMHPHQKRLSKSLAVYLIVKCGLPVPIVDNPGFHRFVTDQDSMLTRTHESSAGKATAVS